MFIICLLLWFVFNGKITLEIVLFGVAVSAAACGMAKLLFGYTVRKDLAFMRKLPGILRLLCTLFSEIVKANIAVIKKVHSRRECSPVFVSFDAPLKSTGGRVALADCITLTPGTITGGLEDSHFTVHCLDSDMASGLDSSCFVSQLSALEEKESGK